MFGSASFSLSRKIRRRPPSTLLTTGALVCGEQDQIAFLRADFGFDCFHFFRLDELRGGSFQAFGCYRQSGQTLRPKRLRRLGQRIHFLAGVFRTAGRDNALDHAAAFDGRLKDAELALRKDIADIDQFHAKAQVGFVRSHIFPRLHDRRTWATARRATSYAA